MRVPSKDFQISGVIEYPLFYGLIYISTHSQSPSLVMSKGDFIGTSFFLCFGVKYSWE
jgi:hypothetical protein